MKDLGLPASIPDNVLEKMATMTDAQRKPIIDYYARNDAEEKRHQQRERPAATVKAKKAQAPRNPGLISDYIRRPEVAQGIPTPEESIVDRYYKGLMTLPKDESLYKKVVSRIASNRGWDQENTELFSKWKEQVAQFESKGDPSAVQVGGGPGRGKFQYETSQGSAANKTAINRFMKFVSEDDIPKADLEIIKSEDPDFSELSEDTQDAIFAADKALDKGTSLDDLVDPERFRQEAYNQWRTGHWKGNEGEWKKRLRWMHEIG